MPWRWINCIHPRIQDLSTPCKWRITFTLLRLLVRGKTPGYSKQKSKFTLNYSSLSNSYRAVWCSDKSSRFLFESLSVSISTGTLAILIDVSVVFFTSSSKHQDSISVILRLLTSRSFLIHHSSIILSFKVIYFRYLKSRKSNPK
jgi:hypothetical protein